MKAKQVLAQYTLEFKLEAVRQTGVGSEYRQDNDIG